MWTDTTHSFSPTTHFRDSGWTSRQCRTTGSICSPRSDCWSMFKTMDAHNMLNVSLEEARWRSRALSAGRGRMGKRLRLIRCTPILPLSPFSLPPAADRRVPHVSCHDHRIRVGRQDLFHRGREIPAPPRLHHPQRSSHLSAQAADVCPRGRDIRRMVRHSMANHRLTEDCARPHRRFWP
jgi:hypothetical protein